ncbi:MAG: hypothetical protein FWG30_05420 [Eubacteriaceae bacterium]|nr:hypothetical protein [Eubacteriaceae bacterium]
MNTKIQLSLVLPKTITNDYKGKKAALNFFYFATAITIVRSLIHMLAPDGGAQSLATIPLDHYSHPAKATIIYLFGTWGLSQLIMGVFYLIVAVRYKSLVPLMYIFIAFEYFMRIVIGRMKPIALTGTAPGAMGNLPFLMIAVLMFALSVSQTTGMQTK